MTQQNAREILLKLHKRGYMSAIAQLHGIDEALAESRRMIENLKYETTEHKDSSNYWDAIEDVLKLFN
ncbi:MAG: hypothetical protein WC810_03110 [Janthinobacterium sp.]|jgi:hypothetical protein